MVDRDDTFEDKDRAQVDREDYIYEAEGGIKECEAKEYVYIVEKLMLSSK